MTLHRKVSFHDIKEEVKARIENRVWPQGSLLPTEMELAEEFGCARATVNRALRELAEQGLVDRKRKSGTRVKSTPSKQAKFEISVVRRTIEDMNATYRYALVHRSIIDAPAWLRAQINVAEGAQILHLNCMHYADNQPFQFEDRWINIDAVKSVVDADFSTIGPNEWLLEAVPFSNAEITFSAVGASGEVADFLATPKGTPLFQLERTTWFRSKPITFVRMTFQPGYRMSTRY
jgi:GntR family histidine utilization transcriptional repressor